MVFSSFSSQDSICLILASVAAKESGVRLVSGADGAARSGLSGMVMSTLYIS